MVEGGWEKLLGGRDEGTPNDKKSRRRGGSKRHIYLYCFNQVFDVIESEMKIKRGAVLFWTFSGLPWADMDQSRRGEVEEGRGGY